MTTPSSTIDDLIERLKAATGPDRQLDADICLALNYMPTIDGKPLNLRLAESDGMRSVGALWLDYEANEGGRIVECTDTAPGLTASIDEAFALMDRLLPGAQVTLRRDPGGNGWWVSPNNAPHAQGATLPLAILLATLRALKGDQNDE